MAKDWYAINSKPHREQVARENLENQGFEVFLPLARRTVRHARKTEQKLIAYFPGYLFASSEDGQWRSITGTRGVRRLILAGDQPALVPEGLITALRRQADPQGVLRYDGPLTPGDRVRIDEGPFADLIGVVHSFRDEDRVRVLLDLMASAAPVELARRYCTPVGGR